MKRICALTMVRNDEFYLRKWVEYYGAQLGRENLYVYFDGVDQQVPEWCEGVNICVREKVVGQVAKADKGRINFLSERAAELLGSYDLVIGTDADEILVVDPALGLSLAEFLSRQKIATSLSGLGVDVGQHDSGAFPLSLPVCLSTWTVLFFPLIKHCISFTTFHLCGNSCLRN